LCTIDLELFYAGVRLEGRRGKVVGRGEEKRKGRGDREVISRFETGC